MADTGVPGCWAAGVSPCEGKITGEHVSSKVLLDETVFVRGFPWCKDELREIRRERLVCNCLCEGHNRALAPVDAEAGKWKKMLEWIGSQPPYVPGRPKVIVRSGFLLAKWMAKTACNQASVAKQPVPAALSRYAFSNDDDPNIHVYFAVTEGDSLAAGKGHHGTRWFLDQEHVVIAIPFFGVPFVLSTFPITATDLNAWGEIQSEIRNWDYIDRLRRIEVATRKSPTSRKKRVVGVVTISWPASPH